MVEVQRYLRLQVGGRSQDIGPRFADRQCVIVAVNMVKIINGLVGSTVNGKIITMYGCCGYGCGPDRNFFALRATVAQAQEETKQDVKKVAKKAGHKTASVASKGKAKVTDQRYKEKMGPNGENVYIDNRSRYYWVDKKGKRHYITSEQLKSRVD